MLEQKYLDEYLPFNRNQKGYNIQESSSYKKTPHIKIYKCKNNVDYYKVVVDGCFPHYVEKEYCDNTPIDVLEDECVLLDFSKTDENDRAYNEDLKHWIY